MGNDTTNGTCCCGQGLAAHHEAARCGCCGRLVHAYGCLTSVRNVDGEPMCYACVEAEARATVGEPPAPAARPVAASDDAMHDALEVAIARLLGAPAPAGWAATMDRPAA
jgi:hypothetical protein